MRLMKLLGVVFVMVTAALWSAASSASVPAAWPGTAVERNDACEPDFEHPPLCKRRSALDSVPGLLAVLLPPAFMGAVTGGPDLPPFSLAWR